MEFYHELLVEGGSFELCEKKALRFFDLYELVSYENIHSLRQRSLPAGHKDFFDRLELGVRENKTVLEGFLSELAEAGFDSLSDLRDLPQGYPSKLLHVSTHMLDGFFGVDSYFYNLAEDSHWVSPGLRDRIGRHPGSYWLIALEASFASGGIGLERRLARDSLKK
ncbi:MAG: hypothetical protein M0022_08415 [Desulfobacteraceae bacterium]|nr:hypothetical protein [Desulfobacteraceae bacterium]